MLADFSCYEYDRTPCRLQTVFKVFVVVAINMCKSSQLPPTTSSQSTCANLHSSHPPRPSIVSSLPLPKLLLAKLKSSSTSPPSSATNCILKWVEFTMTRVYPQCLSVLYSKYGSISGKKS